MIDALNPTTVLFNEESVMILHGNPLRVFWPFATP